MLPALGNATAAISRLLSSSAMASAASATATKTILRFFRWPAMNEDAARRLAAEASESGLDIDGFESEFCFNVEVEVATDDAAPPVTDAHYAVLRWLFTETFEPSQTSSQSGFSSDNASMIVEVGPRMAFSTAWSSNAVSICHACGLTNVCRVARSRRFRIKCVISRVFCRRLVHISHSFIAPVPIWSHTTAQASP